VLSVGLVCSPRGARGRERNLNSADFPPSTYLDSSRCDTFARMRAFIVVGSRSTADDQFSLDNLPSSSGRLDILLRCIRAALLTSHGLRTDTLLYLVLLGGPSAPRVLRIRGDAAVFLRPDERSLAVLVRRLLGSSCDRDREGFVDAKPGMALARGGLATALADRAGTRIYMLDEYGSDIRTQADLPTQAVTFVLGDHRGLTSDARTELAAIGARPLQIGPIAVHSDDAVAIVHNELDRRCVQALPPG